MTKKVISLICSVVLIAGILVGCNSKGMKDGTYNAEYDNFDVYGWKGQVSITVSKGKISSATFDYINEAGVRKSEDTEYENKMKNVSGIGPAEYSVQYANALVDKQVPEDIDVITGASYAINDLQALATKAIEHANEGNTETAIVKIYE